MKPIIQRLVRVPRDLAPIETWSSEREVDPRDVGVSPRGVDAIWEAVRALYRTGTQPAIALAIRRGGKLVLERAIGHSHGISSNLSIAPDARLVTPRTPFCTFSVSKAVTAVLMHLLDERDQLRLDDPVCEYLPEFAQRGKEWVTIRHVLTHRAGIASVPGGRASLASLADWDGAVAALCAAKPVSLPGRRLAYHAVTGGFILGEIARRVTGRPIEAILADDIARPLGFEHLGYGIAREHAHLVAQNHFTGWPVPFPFSRIIKRALGLFIEDAVEASNDPRWYAAVVPSGNVMATADDLARFFQMLVDRGELDGQRVLAAKTVRRLCVESAYFEPDLTLGLTVRYGQGLMLGALPISLFGPDTPRAFGHYGLVNIVAWGDPDRDLAVGLLTSGKPIVAGWLPRFYGLLTAIGRACPPVPRPR